MCEPKARSKGLAGDGGLSPGHGVELEDMYVVEEHRVLAAADDHEVLVGHESRGVAAPPGWWAAVDGHLAPHAALCGKDRPTVSEEGGKTTLSERRENIPISSACMSL